MFCCCMHDHEKGTLSGTDFVLPTKIAEPITNYFQYCLQHRTIQDKKLAVTCYESSVTFQELQDFSHLIAAKLKERLGVGFKILNPDDEVLIALCLPPSEKMIVLMFAILKLGAAYMPVDPTYPEDCILDILAKFRPVILVTDEAGPILSKFGAESFQTDCILVTLEEIWIEWVGTCIKGNSITALKDKDREAVPFFEPLELPGQSVIVGRPAVVLHTTGLNKDPIGVRIAHLAIMNRISWTWSNLPFRRNGTACLTVPITFVESINQIFAPILKGISLHIFRKEDVLRMPIFIKKLGAAAVTRINLTPGLLARFLHECERMGKEKARDLLRDLKYVHCKGDIISLDLAERFFAIFPSDGKRLCSLYGHTEMSGDVICEKFTSLKKVKKRVVSGRIFVGEVIDNTKVYILTPTRELAEDGEQGQIVVTGLSLALGYVERHGKADGAFQTNSFGNTDKYSRIFFTGDYGRLIKCKDRRYRLLIEGREDSFIRHGANEFVLDDVKDVLLEMETVEHVTMIVFYPGMPQQSIVAFILPRDQFIGKVTEESISAKLRTKLPASMCPVLKIIKEFPLLLTSRLDRHTLMRQYEEEKDSGFTKWDSIKLKNKENVGAAKAILEGIYKFGSIPVEVGRTSLQSTFYDLGGTSMATIRLVSYLNVQGYPITVQEFISAECLEDVINLMENRKALYAHKNDMVVAHHIAMHNDTEVGHKYEMQTMEQRHQREVVHLLTAAYTEKGSLFRYNLITYEQFSKFFNLCWSDLMEQHMSCVVVRKTDYRIVGVAVCGDFFLEIDSSKAPQGLRDYVEFMFEVKGQVMNRLNLSEDAVNEIFECVLMGTLGSLSPSENVRICMYLMEEMVRLANTDHFRSMFFATSNQLMKDLLVDVYDFKILDDFVANEYTSDGSIRPFHLAPGTVSVASLHKVIRLPFDSGMTLLEEDYGAGDVVDTAMAATVYDAKH